jgi:hypothetical protein
VALLEQVRGSGRTDRRTVIRKLIGVFRKDKRTRLKDGLCTYIQRNILARSLNISSRVNATISSNFIFELHMLLTTHNVQSIFAVKKSFAFCLILLKDFTSLSAV